MTTCKQVKINTPLPFFYVGPDLTEGALDAVFYFSLSAKESLLTTPFNQPVNYLKQLPIRIFSVDLPFHADHLPSTEAMNHWASAIEKEETFLNDFLDQLEESMHILFATGSVNKAGVMGLSRGGFIAAHIAARFTKINTIVLFAPLIKLEAVKEFYSLKNSALVEKLSLSHLEELLYQKNIKAYIGGRDTRVQTDLCYEWIRGLIEKAYENGIRSAHIEMALKPSIGHQGHGTSLESFEEGALWLTKKL